MMVETTRERLTGKGKNDLLDKDQRKRQKSIAGDPGEEQVRVDEFKAARKGETCYKHVVNSLDLVVSL